MKSTLALASLSLALFAAGCGGAAVHGVTTTDAYIISATSSGEYSLTKEGQTYSMNDVPKLVDAHGPNGFLSLVAPGGLTAALGHQDAKTPRGINISRGGGTIQDVSLAYGTAVVRISNFDDSSPSLPVPGSVISRGGDPNVYVYVNGNESVVPRAQFQGRLAEVMQASHTAVGHLADLDPIAAVTAAEVNYQIGL